MFMKISNTGSVRLIAILASSLWTFCALARENSGSQDSAATAPAATSEKVPENSPGPEKVDVESIKEKYWARGDESELGVVQNRLYSKARKIQIGLFGGALTSDPFLTIKTLGLSAAFHFSEYFAVGFTGWKAFVSPSSALETMREIGQEANINPPSSFFSAEGTASVLYGKLSLLGLKIIYYDLHLSAGAGITSTENGRYFSPSFGLGQQIYVSKNMSLRLDYRLLPYNEEIREKVVTPLLGQSRGFRMNWTHAITLGLNFMFGYSDESQPTGQLPNQSPRKEVAPNEQK